MKLVWHLEWYPCSVDATPEQFANVEFSTIAVHWHDLHEDLGIKGLLKNIHPKTRRKPETLDTNFLIINDYSDGCKSRKWKY